MKSSVKLKANIRVRALLVTADGHLLLIRRLKVGQEPYWVFPGGGVEPSDRTAEDAVVREVAEEVGGVVDVLKLVYVLHRTLQEDNVQDELYFLCRLLSWDGKQTGPEFQQNDRGEYLIDLFPTYRKSIEALNIKPEVMKDFLLKNAESLNTLPDLRELPTGY